MEDLQAKIWALVRQDCSQAYIARRLRMSTATFRKLVADTWLVDWEGLKRMVRQHQVNELFSSTTTEVSR